jgi:hypothetical protein
MGLFSRLSPERIAARLARKGLDQIDAKIDTKEERRALAEKFAEAHNLPILDESEEIAAIEKGFEMIHEGFEHLDKILDALD